VDSEAYNSVGGFVFGELGRLPKRGDMVQANGYSLRVEAVRENRVEAVRIRDHEARGEEPPANGQDTMSFRPVEQAASTPREVEPRESE
jgi:Mg2+/Co2+ transporter CorC